ncbi:PA14 domain-containing protein [Bacillus sp. FJAT-18017]|uniref:PA14 domain-containing protein n=1 Tax=Bacillus sp. FJAT-18017 TaxID=1705566 RepID=UPI0006AE1C2F|nr:PA14 domain-containing protein [Bacillus sp. FJAT-18017]
MIALFFIFPEGKAHAAEENWKASFYPQLNYQGTPIVKTYSDVNFSWGGNSPVAGIPKDSFSAKISKRVTISEPGLYTFSGTADDGIRIYVNGKNRLNKWTDGVHNFSTNVYLTQGTHVVTIGYYDKKWSATLKVDLAKADEQLQEDTWKATYYPSLNFTGIPVTATVNELDFSWGGNSPAEGIPTDNFTAVYAKQLVLDKPKKFKLSGKADDGIRVYVDGKKEVDLWQDGVNPFEKELSLEAGTHTILVEYYDKKWSATLKLGLEDITPVPVPEVPAGHWSASFYPTADLTGTPVQTSYQDLNFSWGGGSPDPAIPADNFSAVFEKTVTVDETGNYKIIGTADDGMKIYVDGVLKVNEWKDGVSQINESITLAEGSHKIRVEYYDRKWSATLRLDLIEDFWRAQIYPTAGLTGTPVNLAYADLNLSWGAGSPHSSIPVDGFSGIFEKQINIEKAGKYRLTGKADDGARIYVDGIKQVDVWKDGVNTISHDLTLSKGLHTIKVEYYDRKWSATLNLDLKEVLIGKSFTYTSYPNTLAEAVAIQMNYSQTDKKYDAYVRSDALTVDTATPNTGIVNGVGWNVRGGKPIDGWVLGKLNDKERVSILSKTAKLTDGYIWYKINYNRSWVNPSPEDISYYLNPNTFPLESRQSYQFIKLSQPAESDPNEVNQKVLASKGVLTAKASVFLQAGRSYNINEIYLIAHALHETGNGTSHLGTGVKVNVKRDANGNVVKDGSGNTEIVVLDRSATKYDAIVYNMYGIGAYDSCALNCGAKKAYNEGWTTVDKAIIGGAQFVAESYIHRGQDTLYKMKFNPARPGYHQYATDIGWAVKQTPNIYNIYQMLDSYSLIFDIPSYK